jgi:hypothetical protein
MPIVYIPAASYATNAHAAETIDSADLGNVRAGASASVSFRVGNVGETVTDLTLSVDHPAASLSVTALTLAPGECSDTLTATVSAAIDCPTQTELAYIRAATSELELSWQTVGANVDRTSQAPERAGPYSDKAADMLYNVGEPLRIYRFDPLPYDPTDTRIFVGGRGTRFSSQSNVCTRLDPLDTRWGYSLTTETVVGAFQSEEWETTEQVTVEDGAMSWRGSAVLYLPAEFELQRQWALFNPARGVDADQYKRTVFLTQRQGQVWCLHLITPVYRGDELSYWRCRLVPLAQPSPNDVGYYNPFAVTYENESDRPYATYACSIDVSFTDILSS